MPNLMKDSEMARDQYDTRLSPHPEGHPRQPEFPFVFYGVHGSTEPFLSRTVLADCGEF